MDGLTLTVEQNTTYTSLETAFKKDAAKWNAENPIDPEAVKKARETGDKEALRQFGEKRQGLMDIRKGYLDNFAARSRTSKKPNSTRRLKTCAAEGKNARPTRSRLIRRPRLNNTCLSARPV